MSRATQILIAAWFALGLTACETVGDKSAEWTASILPSERVERLDIPQTIPPALSAEQMGATETVNQPGTVKYFSSDEAHKIATEHFNRGEYALAERDFRTAVELAPNDPASWIGLAGSYDRTGRFDLADRAYRHAIRLVGETTQILNNQGYSYMLRGDLVNARKKFELAYKREPDNPTILNNIELLNGSYRFVKRDGEADASDHN
jgi:Flp pilus assembly protein TadD